MLLLISARLEPAIAVEAHHEMVVAEGDLAAQAGLEILKHGGNAVDAAVATSLALGVTNSGSCGIGGGGFMLIYWAKTRKLYALDYRERAPMTASSTTYIRDGKPDEDLARTGALAVAVPGEIAGLDAALKRFGTMRFSQVAAPAIRVAHNGFPLSPHMAQDVALTASRISRDPGFRGLFFKTDGAPRKAGDIVHAPSLATLIGRLGDAPVANFYHGDVAAQTAEYLHEHGGLITVKDLADYRPIWREPIHLHYRHYEIYSMPPPSSGGVVLEILGMLASGRLAGLGIDSPPYLARLIEVMRQGFIDRDQYADPAFVDVPLTRLLSPQHMAQAREEALHHGATPHVSAAHDHGTSNFCVVDTDGDVVVVTTTINTIFGAKMTVPSLGLILNDEMDDFAIAPHVANAFKLVQAEANAVAPGKRPLSSMSPIIALKNGHPMLAAGASGGPTIITGIVQVALGIVDFHLDPERAVANPRIHQQAQPDVVFAEASMPVATTDALAQMGYTIKSVPELGAVNAIRIGQGDLQAAFDPRKGGGAAGD
jgi:gamma-glutamyltranspeptidase/glutathione hydrolase